MTSLYHIAPAIPPVSRHTTGAEVYERFDREPDTLAIAVVDEAGRPVGLVERNAFLVRMAAQYGRALWSGRPIETVMNDAPLIVDGETTVEEFCGRILEESPANLLHGFIVTSGGRYAGVGAMLALLQATASLATAAQARAQAARDARTRFLAVMSHEIRTPLNGVLAAADIARRKLRQDDLAPLLEMIVDSGDVLLRLLNDVLDVSRAEARGLEFRDEPIQVVALIADVRRLWRPQAEAKGLAFEVEHAVPEDLWALGDAGRLRQVLNNLVSNALKFTPEGQVRLRVRADVEAGSARLLFAVDDDGPGVPADEIEAIFSPFHQTAAGADKGGTGLGLAVCRALAERMGGGVSALNRPEGGATFEFEAPMQLVSAPHKAEPHAAAHLDRRAHVLVADDNPNNRRIAKDLCEIFGCTTECVADGVEAVEAASSGRFDLILMDIKMPRMDGIEATRRIRSSFGAYSRTPILALTANADPADAEIYRRTGANGVVSKPIRAEELLQAMAAVLGEAEAEEPLALAV
jgi:signal transduction histidine kinase/ActR/RegA family two-component response regulator